MTHTKTYLPTWFVLTDGLSILSDPQFINTQDELDKMQSSARISSDGNVWWIPEYCDLADKCS